MLTIDCPACDATVVVDPPAPRVDGSLHGSVAACECGYCIDYYHY